MMMAALGFVGCVFVKKKEGQQQTEVHHSWCPMTSGRLEEETFVQFPELQYHPYSKGSRQQMHIPGMKLLCLKRHGGDVC